MTASGLFREPWVLLVLAAGVAVLAGLAWLTRLRRAAALARWGGAGDIPRTLQNRRRLQFILGLGGTALLLLALAGPQWGVELAGSPSEVRHVVLALDLSASMLAEDVKPSRLERAKSELGYLLQNLKGDRVGVIAFSGRARVHCPLTTDLAAARMFLNSLAVGSIPQPGTAIGEAIRLSERMLAKIPGTKALVLISDGEDTLDSGAVQAAQAAAQEGILVFSVGVGTPGGAPIPLRDASGGLQGYKKDRQGRTVITRLDERGLRELAALSGGEYLLLSDSGLETAGLLQKLHDLQTLKLRQGIGRRFKNRYEWPLLLAWLLLLAEFLLPERPGKRSTAAAVLGLAILAAAPARAAAVDELRMGSRELGKGRYQEALIHFQAAQRQAPDDPRAAYQLGSALYRLGRYDEAAQAFQQAEEKAGNKPGGRFSAFNKGNALFQAGDYGAAAKAYRESLVADTADRDAAHNLALALLNQQEKQRQQGQKKKDKDQDRSKKNGPGENKPQNRSQDSSGMSPEDAQRILQAVQEREQQIKPELLDKRLQKGQSSGQVEKDW